MTDVVIVERDTSRARLQLPADHPALSRLNTARYVAVPVRQYLETLNRRIRQHGGSQPPATPWSSGA